MFFPFVSIGENSKFVFRIKERETLACHRDDVSDDASASASASASAR